MNKEELRKEASEVRKIISSREKDVAVIKRLRALKEYKEAKNVLIYYPLKHEINDLICLKDEKKNFYLPRVSGELLEICKYDVRCLSKGCYGITEPSNECISDLSEIDVVITPCIAADVNGYRLGYGKGYYDRLFAREDLKALKILLIYSDLIYESVYPEKHDKKCDFAVSEKFLLKF